MYVWIFITNVSGINIQYVTVWVHQAKLQYVTGFAKTGPDRTRTEIQPTYSLILMIHSHTI